MHSYCEAYVDGILLEKYREIVILLTKEIE